MTLLSLIEVLASLVTGCPSYGLSLEAKAMTSEPLGIYMDLRCLGSHIAEDHRIKNVTQVNW